MVTASRLDIHGVVVGDAISMPDTCVRRRIFPYGAYGHSVFSTDQEGYLGMYRQYLSDQVDV